MYVAEATDEIANIIAEIKNKRAEDIYKISTSIIKNVQMNW